MSNEPQLERLPLLPLRGKLAFPNMVVRFEVGRDKSLAAIALAMQTDHRVMLVAQRNAAKDDPHAEDLYGVGTIAVVKQVFQRGDETVGILAEGESRALLADVLEGADMQYAMVAPFSSKPDEDPVGRKYHMDTLKKLCREYAKLRGDVPPELRQAVEGEGDADTLGDLVAVNFLRECEAQQQLLETRDVRARLTALEEMMRLECEYAKLERKIHQRVQAGMEKNQKEYYLREQLRVIHEELGDDVDETAELEDKLAKLAMNDEARERTQREIAKLSRTPAQSPEASVCRNYIETLLELPWETPKSAEIAIARARKVLEQDHYGLEPVKERILEYLAVRSIKGDVGGTILCLVGPPGVGKTSIAKSIARALKRPFAHLSLGGVNDESELRGHRRTYLGAIPGRILSAIRQCKATNPVFLLDEIDKMGASIHGDPASALLEALDPEQNATFRDHYVEAPYDLSHVFFIATANTMEGIPAPLLDRMELIEVPSYTLEEKVQIAKRHLWPKELSAHGLKRGQIRVSEKTIQAVIDGYTREAGVRQLERELAAIIRKVALRWADLGEEERAPVTVGPGELGEYLGVKRFSHLATLKTPETGVVNGLAWTSVGGETLSVEVAVMPGSGTIDLTGRLGDVMKESARTAYSYIRSMSGTLKIPSDFYKQNDLHIHVPEGATPKDGPSAGVAMTCAMVSAITGRPARQDIAMTGEVTLRGRVLPIGGVKEKLLAAHRMGIDTILLPAENARELEELPREVREQMDVKMIGTVDQALQYVLQ